MMGKHRKRVAETGTAPGKKNRRKRGEKGGAGGAPDPSGKAKGETGGNKG